MKLNHKWINTLYVTMSIHTFFFFYLLSGIGLNEGGKVRYTVLGLDWRAMVRRCDRVVAVAVAL